MLNKNLFFMREAYKQAEKALADNEIPVGAVIICKDQIIAKAYNQTERLKDPTAHAEMIAITSACNFLNSKYLDECTLYVTLQPCGMCAAAIEHAHIKDVFFGTYDNRASEPKKQYNLQGGWMELECQTLLDEFFQNLREKKKL